MLRCWTFSCTCAHTSCYDAGRSVALPHMHHATLLEKFCCTSTHTACYAAGRSVALPHIRHATLLDVLLRFHTYGMLRCWISSVCTSTHTSMLRCWTFCCASTHTSCYAAGRSLALRHIHHASLLAIHSVAYPHIRHAKLLTSLALPHIALGGQITVVYFCCGKTLDFPILR